MKKEILIAPSILAANFLNLASELKKLEEAKVDLIHFDIMDGHFVPNLTFGPMLVEACRKHCSTQFDAHLMVTEPEKYVDDFAKAGCNWLSVHLETCPHLHKILSHIRSLNMKAGIAINPGTSYLGIEPLLDFIDYVLVMSVNPGFGGQKFIPETLEKVKSIKKIVGTRNILIEMDGGLKLDNIEIAAKAGVDVHVVGTGFFSNPNYAEQFKLLKAKGGSACI